MALTKQCLSFCFLLLLVGGSADTTAKTTDAPSNTTDGTTTVNIIDGTTTVNITTVSDVTTVNATTPKPGESTTVGSTPASVNSTTAANTTATGGTTTVASTSAPGGHTTTAIAITTSAPGPCASSPCPSYSICQELLKNYTCLCGPGLFYDEVQKSCNLAKTFLGDLKLDKAYEEEMANNKSQTFKDTVNAILGELNIAFQHNSAYLGSTILSLKQGSVIAAVENFFTFSSDVNEETVAKELQTAINSSTGILSGAGITYKDICTTGFCDVSSTTCAGENGLASCNCKEGYIKVTATQQACIPCPSGKKAVNLEQCAECPFGYSGFNCEESYLLILVVVACVLGTLLLGTLTGAMVLYSRSKKTTKSSEKTPKDGSLEFTKPDGIPRIPRANANSGWQPSNLAMTDSGSRSALVTRNRPENTEMWDYNYSVDTRSFKDQTPSRTGYGAAVATNGSRATRNPYYD